MSTSMTRSLTASARRAQPPDRAIHALPVRAHDVERASSTPHRRIESPTHRHVNCAPSRLLRSTAVEIRKPTDRARWSRAQGAKHGSVNRNEDERYGHQRRLGRDRYGARRTDTSTYFDDCAVSAHRE